MEAVERKFNWTCSKMLAFLVVGQAFFIDMVILFIKCTTAIPTDAGSGLEDLAASVFLKTLPYAAILVTGKHLTDTGRLVADRKYGNKLPALDEKN